jgi:hypothetical protein
MPRMPQKTSEPGFYLVWREGGSNPTAKHGFEEQATQEASRLARNAPGVAFTVLRAVTRVRLPPPNVELIPLDDPDAMPF